MMWSNAFIVRSVIVASAYFFVGGYADAQGFVFTSIGKPAAGRIALEYVGVIKQDDRNEGEEFEVYGYFTHIHGLDDKLL